MHKKGSVYVRIGWVRLDVSQILVARLGNLKKKIDFFIVL